MQRSKVTDLLQGDNNTSYFMAKASGRKRRNKILQLQQEEGLIQGDKDILAYATNFYKELFGPVDLLPISLSQAVDCVLDDQDREMLNRDFSLEEIKNVVFSMAHNKASGPDGFPIEFYQRFWPIVCNDLLTMFKDFNLGKLDNSRFNYGVITMLPKGQGANKIQMYRPICLSNVMFKFFTKAVHNKTTMVADKVVDEIQSAFIKGRYILDNVIMLHECLDDLHRHKKSACSLR